MRYNIFSGSNCPILNILSIGYSSDTSVTRFGPGVRNLYIIHYVVSGKGYFNGNTICTREGFLISPNMVEHYYPDENDPWAFLWLISDDTKMSNLFELYNADKRTNIFQYDYCSVVKDLAQYITVKNNALFDSFEILEFFLKLFKHQQNQAVTSKNTSNADSYVSAAQRYIDANLQNPITVCEITDFLGITQPYLFKLFKQHLSISPKQYILQQKLTHAKTLLTQTNLSVTDVANSVGFPDVLSFSKFFKLKTGISPQNYRNKN